MHLLALHCKHYVYSKTKLLSRHNIDFISSSNFYWHLEIPKCLPNGLIYFIKTMLWGGKCLLSNDAYMQNSVTLALMPPCNKTGSEALSTVGSVGRHILPAKHICFREQVFKGMESGEVKACLTKLIKPTRCSLT